MDLAEKQAALEAERQQMAETRTRALQAAEEAERRWIRLDAQIALLLELRRG